MQSSGMSFQGSIECSLHIAVVINGNQLLSSSNETPLIKHASGGLAD